MKLRTWGIAHQTELLVFGAAFGLRILYALFVLLYVGQDGFIAFSDAKAFYYREALNLAAGHGFSLAMHAPYYPNAYHTPLYPLFVSFFYVLHLPTFFVIFAQCVLAALTVVLFYRIAFFLTRSQKIAWITGILATLEPMSIYWCGLLMSDILFAFLQVASFHYVLRKQYVHSSIFLGLAILTRPIALYFIPAYVIYVAYETYQKKRSFSDTARNTFLVLILVAAVISPWYARNKIVFDTWALSSAGWYNLYATAVAQFAHDEGMILPTIPIDVGDPDSFRRFSFEYTPFYHDTVMHEVVQAPLHFAVFEFKRSWSSFFASKYWYLWHYVIAVKFPSLAQIVPELLVKTLVRMGDFAWIVTYLLACCALMKRRLWPVWIFAASVVVINAALSGIIDPVGPQMTRYSIPFFGFYFAFAGTGLVFIDDWLKKIRQDS
jgi:hypothetical protein